MHNDASSVDARQHICVRAFRQTGSYWNYIKNRVKKNSEKSATTRFFSSLFSVCLHIKIIIFLY